MNQTSALYQLSGGFSAIMQRYASVLSVASFETLSSSKDASLLRNLVDAEVTAATDFLNEVRCFVNDGDLAGLLSCIQRYQSGKEVSPVHP